MQLDNEVLEFKPNMTEAPADSWLFCLVCKAWSLWLELNLLLQSALQL